MFIPCVVSGKILKLQHQKELVVAAMLNNGFQVLKQKLAVAII
jgi:hypothetical protein